MQPKDDGKTRNHSTEYPTNERRRKNALGFCVLRARTCARVCMVAKENEAWDTYAFCYGCLGFVWVPK
eukprot:291503-Amphidinium_carterae.1